MGKETMLGEVRWPWAESLGGVRPDAERAFRVKRILFGLVRDRCFDMGLQEGQEVRCRDRTREQVLLELPGGGVHSLELPYAWFIEVSPVGEDAPVPTA